jgi:hypothetical protein
MFKVGDKVRCVDEVVKDLAFYNFLVKGRIYTVKEVSDRRVWIDEITYGSWNNERFELVQEQPTFVVKYPANVEIFNQWKTPDELNKMMANGDKFTVVRALYRHRTGIEMILIRIVSKPITKRETVTLEKLNQMIKDHVDFEVE